MKISVKPNSLHDKGKMSRRLDCSQGIKNLPNLVRADLAKILKAENWCEY